MGRNGCGAILERSIKAKHIYRSAGCEWAQNHDQGVFTNTGVMLSNSIKIPQQMESLPLLPLFKALSLCAKMLNKTIGKNPTLIILP